MANGFCGLLFYICNLADLRLFVVRSVELFQKIVA